MALTRVLFVCLGNICRSPLAEAAFRREAEAAGLTVEIDSAGTGHWHIGKLPDPRSQQIALVNGVDISGQRARQLAESDFAEFTHILAMDQDNLHTIRAMMPDDSAAFTGLFLDLVPGSEGQEVPDPYYGGEDGFEEVWGLVAEAARHLARELA